MGQDVVLFRDDADGVGALDRKMHSQMRRSCPRSHRKWWDTLPLSRLAIQYERASA
jgi:hypothetical protein